VHLSAEGTSESMPLNLKYTNKVQQPPTTGSEGPRTPTMIFPWE